jgi:hypothetical protein
MDTDPNGTDEDTSEKISSTSKTDGGVASEFDEATLYFVVRNAVEDALLSVIGTLLLVGVAFVIIMIGASIFLAPIAPLGKAIGAILVIIGFYIAGATLEIIPLVSDWI